MKPRTAPRRHDTAPEVIEELRKYGGVQRYRLSVLAAGQFWQEKARTLGLPEDWEHRQVVILKAGDLSVEYRIYVQTIARMRLGFAERHDGETLRFLLLWPMQGTTLGRAVDEAIRRT